MIAQLNPLSEEESDVLVTLQNRYSDELKSMKKKKISKSSVLLGVDRYGAFTNCLLLHKDKWFIGTSKLSTNDLKMAKKGTYKISSKTGEMFAINNAFRSLLGLNARNGHPLKSKTTVEKLIIRKEALEKSIKNLEDK